MKKSIKCGIVAAVAVAAGFAAYQSHGSYGLQDNSLLMQNIEALADDKDGDTDGDPNSGSNGNKHTECLSPADMVSCYRTKAPHDFMGFKWTYRKKTPFVQRCICMGPESQACPKGSKPKDEK
jgi:hypothetical protein